ncbi:MAG: DNA pilot protein [Microviridae sp.]|nr:MAG: DNA pilot protein [Microviridae sp.]
MGVPMDTGQNKPAGGGGFDIGTMGLGIASDVIGTGLGMLTAKWQDKRQLKQQEKLQDLSIKGSKEMTDYQKQKELQMWKDTNYGAQMEQLKGAGLNPGLIYGMSGGGGVTTGGGAASVGQGHAPSGGGEVGMGIQQTMQLALMKAQKDNIDADTANKKAQGNLAGANIPKVGAETGNIHQDTENKKLQAEGIQYDNTFKKVQAEIAGQTQEDVVNGIGYRVQMDMDNMIRNTRENMNEELTNQDKIKAIRAGYIGATIDNMLKASNIQVNDAAIQKMSADIAQNAVKLGQGDVELLIKNELMKVSQGQLQMEQIKLGVQAVTQILGVIPK